MTNAGGGQPSNTTGMVHSPTSAIGTGWERTPWHALQGAVQDALRRAEANNT
jgi:hypothetical protein